MKIFKKSGLLFILIFMLTMSNSLAYNQDKLNMITDDMAKYMLTAVNNPQMGSIGGEWAVFGLARSGYEVPNLYYQKYYKTVEEYVKACGGILHAKKYTEYSRLILTLTAIGKDPKNVAGYNLIEFLGDYDKTIWQGLNGPIWALIALDSGNYEMPQNGNATRDMYINRILDCQLPDGGFSLFGKTSVISDPDITGMALVALSKYQDREDVQKVTKQALACMSEMQNEVGGFSSWESENLESAVQIMIALCELGIPLDDPRFVKNGNTLLDNVLTFYKQEDGFSHTKQGNGSNQMASEQGFYGLIAAKRFIEGKSSLYRINDALNISVDIENEEYSKIEIKTPGKTFSDIGAHENQMAIESLASRGIISGKTNTEFEPNQTITRAELSAIIVRCLNLQLQDMNNFSDISLNDWFCKEVNTAFSYGIVNGVSDKVFRPEGEITKGESAVMISRAARLCGLNTDIDTFAARDILAGFTDYIKIDDWAMSSIAFCVNNGILSDKEMQINANKQVTRGETAQMLFNMLSMAKLM